MPFALSGCSAQWMEVAETAHLEKRRPRRTGGRGYSTRKAAFAIPIRMED